MDCVLTLQTAFAETVEDKTRSYISQVWRKLFALSSCFKFSHLSPNLCYRWTDFMQCAYDASTKKTKENVFCFSPLRPCIAIQQWRFLSAPMYFSCISCRFYRNLKTDTTWTRLSRAKVHKNDRDIILTGSPEKVQRVDACEDPRLDIQSPRFHSSTLSSCKHSPVFYTRNQACGSTFDLLIPSKPSKEEEQQTQTLFSFCSPSLPHHVVISSTGRQLETLNLPLIAVI